MNEMSSYISLKCPVCGCDEFEAVDVRFQDDLSDAPDDTLLQCTKCGNTLTRGALQELNQDLIVATAEEMLQDWADNC